VSLNLILSSSTLVPGDLVQSIKETEPWAWPTSALEHDRTGIVIRVDVHHDDCSNNIFPIAEVLWEHGTTWVDMCRLKRIEPNEDR